MIIENGLPAGVYVCRVVRLERLGRLHLAVAHGPHAGKIAAQATRSFGGWLRNLPDAERAEIEDAHGAIYAELMSACRDARTAWDDALKALPSGGTSDQRGEVIRANNAVVRAAHQVYDAKVERLGARILQLVGPTFLQMVRAEVPPGKVVPRSLLIAGTSNFHHRKATMPPAELAALMREALGTDPLLSFEETLARYRASAADELASIFGSTVTRSARR